MAQKSLEAAPHETIDSDLSRWFRRRVGSACSLWRLTIPGVVARLVLYAAASLAEPARYEPGLDPIVGVNLISWANFGEEGDAVWRKAVQDIHDHGFGAVSISPVRFVDPETGEIHVTTKGPDFAHVAAGIQEAKLLQMSVTVNPFVEPDGFKTYRGDLKFSGDAQERFWTDYLAYVLDVATVAQASNADRLLIGTELNTLVNESRHNRDWLRVIDAVRTQFAGQLGYAANWDSYDNANLTMNIWENDKIDFMGVDTYAPLATTKEAMGPGRPSVDVLETNWGRIIDQILEFAARRRGGQGVPFVMTEHGTIPFDETTAQPFNRNPSDTEDPQEQRNDYEALVRASDRRRARPASEGRLDEIHFWHWGMRGAEGSPWFLDAEGNDITTGAQAARFLSCFALSAGSCTGDCDCSGCVTIDELITMVNVALGTAALAACIPGDADGSGDITINEIISAVSNALNGCPAPSPTSSPRPSVTSTESPIAWPSPTNTPTPSCQLLAPPDGASEGLQPLLDWEISNSGDGLVYCSEVITDKGSDPTDNSFEESFAAGSATSLKVSLDPVRYGSNEAIRWTVHVTECAEPGAVCQDTSSLGHHPTNPPEPCVGRSFYCNVRTLHTSSSSPTQTAPATPTVTATLSSTPLASSTVTPSVTSTEPVNENETVGIRI